LTIDDQIREQVFERERARWAKITATPGAFGRLLQSIFGKNPAEGLFIVEHEAADPDTLQCAGNILQAWRLDERGPRAIDPAEVDPGRTIGRMWQYQLVRLFISEDNEHVFLNEMDGPKQGMLIYMRPRTSNGKVTLKVVRASPVLGGHAIG
jgi:hypothetical protein